jgi:uncharacterized lipoprotein NlpE involved in copper resistance
MNKLLFYCLLFLALLGFPSFNEAGEKNNNYIFANLSGILPCTDCKGIKTKLTLYSEGKFVGAGSFELEETYLGKDEALKTTIGHWTTERGNKVDENAVVYYLSEGDLNSDKRIIRYEKIGPRTVRLLDEQGAPIKSKKKYLLNSTTKIN